MISISWQEIFALSPDPIVILDRLGTLIDENKAFFELDLANKSAILLSLFETINQQTKACLLQTDDKKTWLQWSITPFTWQNETFFSCLSQPVTDLINATKQSQTLQTSIIDLLPNHIFWKDKNSVYLGCNKSFADELGLSSTQEIVGKTDYDLLTTPEQSESYRKDDKIVMQSKKSKIDIQEKQKRRDGYENTLLTSKIPIFDEQQKVIGILVIYTNISEQNRLEELLRQAKKQAEIANQAKSEFIANMSHDIRTPLTGILGLIQALVDVAADTGKIFYKPVTPSANQQHLNLLKTLIDKVQDDGKLLLDAADELLQLLNEILDTLHLESGCVSQKAESFSLFQLIAHNIELMSPIAQHKQLKLTCDIDAMLPDYIIGLSHYLDRTLLNLLANALKFTSTGFVKLKVAVLGEASLFQPGDSLQLQISIADSGIGISKDKHDVIFEHFSRLTASHQGIYKGSGLGLYTVKHYVQAMGGTIRVESQIGCGSTFVVECPVIVADHANDELIVYQKKSQDNKEKPPLMPVINTALGYVTPDNALPKATILIVEDSVIAARGTVASIKHCCCDSVCDVAETGLDAVYFAANKCYDFILMDIGLPDIDGIEATKRIRVFNSTTPIIALTGHADRDEKKREALAAGMQDVFAKPLSALQIKALIQRFAVNL